jgi:hypothetical protein
MFNQGLAEDYAQPGAGDDWRAVLSRVRKDL